MSNIINGWLARDQDGELHFFTHKPKKVRLTNDIGFFEEQININSNMMEINPRKFKNVVFENSPVKATININI